jgi:hypothetical protein
VRLSLDPSGGCLRIWHNGAEQLPPVDVSELAAKAREGGGELQLFAAADDGAIAFEHLTAGT